jgi:hypothetical protein
MFFIIVHLLYLGFAVWLYRGLLKHVASLPELTRRVTVTGAAALLFSPGLYWYFAFALPTFASLAPFLHILQYFYDGHTATSSFGLASWVVPQVLASVIPIIFFWGALFALVQFRAYFRKRKVANVKNGV